MKSRTLQYRGGAIGALAFSLVLGFAARAAMAATYYWDPGSTNSSSGGGPGTWSTDTGYANWYNGTGDVVWDNSAGTANAAVFDTTGGTVTVATPVSVNALTFNVSGYTLSSAGPITLGGTPTPTITVSGSAGSAWIAAQISGTAGLATAGGGTLYLANSTNNITGGVYLGAGTLNFTSSALNTVSNTINFNGGTLRWASGNTQDISGKISISSSTQTAYLDTNGNAVSFATAISGSGALCKLGSGTLTLSAANTYKGGTVVNNGTLALYSGSGTTNRQILAANSNLTISNGTVSLKTPQAIYQTGGGTVIIGAGGLLSADNASGPSYNQYYVYNLLMGGGTLGASYSGDPTYGNFCLFNNSRGTVSVVTSGAGGAMSVVSASLATNVPSTGSLTFDVASDSPLLVSGKMVFQYAPAVTKKGGGLLILSGTDSSTGSVAISAGTLQIGNGGNGGSISTASAISNSGTLAFNRNDNYGSNFTNAISGPGSLVVLGSGGRLVLAGGNSYQGGTAISAGTLALGNAAALGGSGAGPITINGGVFDLAGITPTISNSLAVTLSSGSVVNSGSAATLTGTAYTVQSGAISVPLNGNSSVNLTKNTGGTVVLSAAMAYTGSTNVNAGALLLSAGSLSGSSPVSVAGGAAFGGNGSAGQTTVLSGGTIQGGYNGLGGLTLGSLTFSGTGAINLTPTSTDASSYTGVKVTATDGLSVSGTNTIAINLANYAALSQGTYRLVAWQGSLQGTGGTAAFQVFPTSYGGAGGSRPTTYTLSPASQAIDVNVVGGAASLAWTGTDNSGAWDVATTKNWNNAGTADVFYKYDNVTFNDSGAGTVTISGSVEPGSITFSNTNVAYTVGGTGYITGATGLAVNGPGSVTINNSNSYTGGTTVSGGQLNLNAAGALGSGPLTVNAGTLNLGGVSQAFSSLGGAGGVVTTNSGAVALTVNIAAGASTFAGALLDGGGTLSLNVNPSGGGTLVLAGPNAYAGGTTIGGGILQVGNGGAAGSLGSGAISNSGTLAFNRNDAALAVSNPIGGPGTVLQNGTGATMLTATNTYTGPTNVTAGTLAIGGGGQLGSGAYSAAISIGSGATFAYTSSAAQTLSGVISGIGQLSQSGSGTLTLSASNTYSGGTTVSQGMLILKPSSGHGLKDNSNLSVSSGTASLQKSGAVYSTAGGMLTVGAGGLVSADNSAGGSSNQYWIYNLAMRGGTLGATYSGDPAYGNFSIYSGGGVTTSGAGGALSVISAALSFNANTTVGLTFNVASDSPLLVSGNVTNDKASVLTKAGPGLLVLAGSNTYNASTVISGGTLLVNSPGSLAAGSAVTVQNTTTLGGNGTVNGLVSVQSGGRLSPGANSGNVGTLTLAGGLAITTATLNFDLGAGTADLLQLGSGALTATSTSTFSFSGASLVTSGTYTLIDYGTFSGSISNFSYPATLGDWALSLFDDTGNTAIKLSVAPGISQWTGAADSVWTNTANWSAAVPDGIGASAGFGTSGTGQATVDLDAADRTLGTLVFSPSAGMTITGSNSLVLQNSGTANATIAVTGTHAINCGVKLGSDAAFTLTASTDRLTIGGNMADGSNGSKGLILTASNAGSLVLAGNNTFTGDTLVSGGKLVVGSSGALLNSTVLEGWDDNVITFSSGVTAATFGGLKGTALTLTNADSNAVRLSVGNNNAGTIYTGALAGLGGLTKVGSGSLTLKYANSYAGDTQVAAGTLVLGVSGALPHGAGKGNVVLDGGATAGTLDLGGYNQQINGLSGVAGAALGQVVNSSTDTKTLTVGDGDATASFAGQIQNAIALVKTGTGTQTLSGSNGYSGGTTVNNGTLGIASADALPTGKSLTIAGGGHVVLASGLSHAISLGGLAIMSGAGAGQTPWPDSGATPVGQGAVSAAPTPEPGTIMLLAVGAVAGLAVRRRRQRFAN